MKEYERIREEMAVLIRDEAGDIAYGYSDVSQAVFMDEFLLPLVKRILSIEGICIKADVQSLPKYQLTDSENSVFHAGTYKTSQQDMLKADFVRVVGKEKNES